jgi:hypothetical protein
MASEHYLEITTKSSSFIQRALSNVVAPSDGLCAGSQQGRGGRQ